MINSYKELIVWQKSFELAKEIYSLTDKFPSREKFGIVLQIRRCAVSIPSNIAEGYARQSTKEYKNFISIAFGSGAELETQISLSKSLSLTEEVNFEKAEKLLNEVMRMLNVLLRKLSTKP